MTKMPTDKNANQHFSTEQKCPLMMEVTLRHSQIKIIWENSLLSPAREEMLSGVLQAEMRRWQSNSKSTWRNKVTEVSININKCIKCIEYKYKNINNVSLWFKRTLHDINMINTCQWEHSIWRCNLYDNNGKNAIEINLVLILISMW